MNAIKKLTFLFLLILFAIGCEEEPQNYNDCILQNLSDDMNETTATAVINACYDKFPESEKVKSESERKLTESELEKLGGRAKLAYDNTFGGKIYNGNSDITVKSLKIKIKTMMENEEVTKIYNDITTINPQTTESFYVEIITGDNGADYSWGISGATGIPTNN